MTQISWFDQITYWNFLKSSDLTLSADDRWSSGLIESADQLIKNVIVFLTLQISIPIPSVSYISYFTLLFEKQSFLSLNNSWFSDFKMILPTIFINDITLYILIIKKACILINELSNSLFSDKIYKPFFESYFLLYFISIKKCGLIHKISKLFAK